MIKYESTTEDEARVGLRFNYRPGISRDAPLVVLVHGRAGNRGVMWTFERSIPGECHVVAFEAFLHDPIGGWSWWDMAVPGSKREAIHQAAERFQRALRAFIDFYGLDPRVLVGAGFSQGSVLLSAVTLLQIVPFDGLAILAGYVYRPSESESLNQKITVNRSTVNHKPTVFVAHGTLDETISIDSARQGVELLKQLGLTVTFIEEPVGHKVGIEGTRGLKDWIARVTGG